MDKEGCPLPDVIYFSGYGRSGSTIFDILLSQHSEVSSGGELFVFLDVLRKPTELCACGKRIGSCKFWINVSKEISLWISERKTSINEMRLLQRRVESRNPLIRYIVTRSWPSLSSREKDLYTNFQKFFFKTLRKNYGETRYIVDSSKTASGAAARILSLSFLAGLSIRVIHLVRDPRGVVNSALKGRNRDLEKGIRTKSRLIPIRAVFGWILANLFEKPISRFIGPEKVMVVRFEDLIRNPNDVLDKTCQFIGIDAQPILSALKKKYLPEKGHTLGGNRLRLGNIRLDPKKNIFDIPWYWNIVCLIFCWPLMKKYGYPMWRSSGSKSI